MEKIGEARLYLTRVRFRRMPKGSTEAATFPATCFLLCDIVIHPFAAKVSKSKPVSWSSLLTRLGMQKMPGNGSTW